MVVVGLVVLVPFVTHLHSVEISGFTGAIFAGPLGLRRRGHGLFAGKDLFVLADALGQLSLIQCLRRLREVIIGK